jgi:hypothetical protein
MTGIRNYWFILWQSPSRLKTLLYFCMFCILQNKQYEAGLVQTKKICRLSTIVTWLRVYRQWWLLQSTWFKKHLNWSDCRSRTQTYLICVWTRHRISRQKTLYIDIYIYTKPSTTRQPFSFAFATGHHINWQETLSFTFAQRYQHTHPHTFT